MDALSVTVTVLVGAASILGFVGTVVAVLVRYMLLPWLEKHIAIPVAETRHQVKVNRHTSEEPTVLDRIEDVGETAKTAVHVARENARHSKQAAALAQEALQEIHTLSNMFDGHLEWSQDQVDKLWAKLREKRDRDEP